MRCRHTVPDWHRHVAAGAETRPIFAACRLLLKEGERVADPLSIACTYWGRQPTCPVYEGPAVAADTRAPRPLDAALGDAPLTTEDIWPVRPPGATDRQRLLLIVLGGLSTAVLGVAIVLSFAALGGMVVSTGFLVVILVGGGLSLATHLLTLLHMWARR